jgi:hypothetical protein
MRTLTAIFLSVGIAVNCLAQVNQGNHFKVRYNGGTATSNVQADDWNNMMTVAPDSILLRLKDGQEITIDPKRVTRLSYSKNTSRNIKGYAAAAIMIHPLFGLGMLKTNKQHFVGIRYENADGSKGAVLVQAKNDRYRSLLETLKAVTNKPVETEDDDN